MRRQREDHGGKKKGNEKPGAFKTLSVAGVGGEGRSGIVQMLSCGQQRSVDVTLKEGRTWREFRLGRNRIRVIF